MNSFKRFEETELCGKECFFSSLKKRRIDDNDEKMCGHIIGEAYLVCKQMWKKLDMKTIGDCHDNYFKKDVLLLADVFEKFIDNCLKYYGLDPCHYFSGPGFNWDAMLKMTGVELEKISDIEKHLFIDKGLKEGISYIAKR